MSTKATIRSGRSQEPGASGSSIQVKGPKYLGLPLLLSQAPYQGVRAEVEQLGLKLPPIWDASVAGGSFNDVPHYLPQLI